MGKKFYTIFLVMSFFAAPAAYSQDSLSCNARFQSYVNVNDVFFIAADSNGPNLHSWNFGDSSTIDFAHSSPGELHTYTHAGTYNVTHIIKGFGSGGCYDSVVQTVTITMPPACTVYFDANRDTVNHHLYSLVAHSLPDPAGSDTIRWFSNDSLMGTGPSLTNIYFPVGVTSVCVRTSSVSGCQAEYCSDIYVPPIDSCSVQASFTYAVDTSNFFMVHFDPLPGNTSAVYRWDFGDSTPVVTEKQPAHIFAADGVHWVTLTEAYHNGPDSCASTISQFIYVTAPSSICAASFTYTVDPTITNQLTFVINDSSKYDSIVWTVVEYPDTSYTQQFHGPSFTHLFAKGACYGVRLDKYIPTCEGEMNQEICIDTVQGTSSQFVSSYPNPTTDKVNLDLKMTTDNMIHIHIFTSMGKEVQTIQTPGTTGMNRVVIPTGNLPIGIYYVEIRFGNEVRRSKIQKL